MLRIAFYLALAALLTAMTLSNPVYAQNADHGSGFIDENGDGYNDNAPDHDGDGIPNGQDPDYVAPGAQQGKGGTQGQTDQGQMAKGFVDENGDGYNDNAPDHDGDGIPNGQDPDYVAPGTQQGKGGTQGQTAQGQKAQGQKSKGFVDDNGDGLNDNAADDDGDGIPNGQDEDYVKPQDGSGQQMRNKSGKGQGPVGFVDENGDGINDNAPDSDGDGIPNGQDDDFERSNLGKRHGKGGSFQGFIDEDGDGFNDNAPDADGDGIPNGQDADWQKPEDCLGRGARLGRGFGGNSDDNGSGAGEGNNDDGGKGHGKGGKG